MIKKGLVLFLFFLILLLGLWQKRQENKLIAPPPAEQKVTTLVATGDMIPARVVNYQTIIKYKDPLWPWRKTADFLKNADLTVINLETPL